MASDSPADVAAPPRCVSGPPWGLAPFSEVELDVVSGIALSTSNYQR
jgi:hypothetical protein